VGYDGFEDPSLDPETKGFDLSLASDGIDRILGLEEGVFESRLKEGRGFLGTAEGPLASGLEADVDEPGVFDRELGVEVSAFTGGFFFSLPNQSWNSFACSPLRVLPSFVFSLSRKISSIVRVSLLTTLSRVRVLGIAASLALTDCEELGD